MTCIEFNAIRKIFKINNSLSKTRSLFGGEDEDVYYWNNLAIYFDGHDSVIINGIIPLEVASTIHEKYPNNPYLINVDGKSTYLDPSFFVVDEQYEKELNELKWDLKMKKINEKEFINGEIRSYIGFKRRDSDNKYIKNYHIKTKEGLLVFLTEMQDYYLRQSNKKETEVENYNELLKKVNSEIIEIINPTITASDWMKKHGEIDTPELQDENKRNQLQILKEALNDFDEAVNPFLNKNVDLDDIKNGSIINASAQRKDNEYYYRLNITNPNIENYTSYIRSSDGFSFNLFLPSSKDQTKIFGVHHYYSNNSYHDAGKGEIIQVQFYEGNNNHFMDIRLNITNQKIYLLHKEMRPITEEEIEFFYNKIVEATNYARNITMKKMKVINHT